MHMSNALIAAPVGYAMWAVSGGLLAYSLKNIRQQGPEKSISSMVVLGVFVLVAQMLSFAIPNVGPSGHIVGAVLLAVLLGPHRAFITMSAILLIQALCFGDGGLFSLGCNIFNMGAIGCFAAYPLVYKPLEKHGNVIASVVSCAVAIPLGAFCIALQAVGTVQFATFASLLVPVHFAIGLAEGAVMSVILYFAKYFKTEVPIISFKMGVVTIAVMGVLSLFTSARPDGLEWSLNKTLGDSHAISEIK